MAKKNKPVAKKSKTKKAISKNTKAGAKVAVKKSSPKVVAKKVTKKVVAKSAKGKVTVTAAKKNSPVKAKAKVAVAVVTKKNSSIKAKTPAIKKMIKAMAVTKVKPSKIDFNNWVTPLDDRILVQTVAEERMTPGGLYIPDTVADVSGNFQGLVVAVGRGHLDKKGKIRPLDVKKGDKVVFSQFSGSKVDYQGESVLFLRESDVLGIVNK